MKKKIGTSKSLKKYQIGGQDNKPSGVIEPNGGIISNIVSKIPAAGAMKKIKTKERSSDGDYVKKTVTRETPAGTSSTTKIRRTVQGILRGAPSVEKYKKGGTVKKKK